MTSSKSLERLSSLEARKLDVREITMQNDKEVMTQDKQEDIVLRDRLSLSRKSMQILPFVITERKSRFLSSFQSES